MKRKSAEATKVINLVKSIEKLAEEGSDDPYLIAMAERAQAVQESFEERQTSTTEALEALLRDVELNEARKKEQVEKSFDDLTYFVYRSLIDAKVQNAEAVSCKIRQAFVEHPNWKRGESALRELRNKVTFAISVGIDDLDRVTDIVNELFTVLEKTKKS
jgi:type I restriction enzyme R subunit